MLAHAYNLRIQWVEIEKSVLRGLTWNISVDPISEQNQPTDQTATIKIHHFTQISLYVFIFSSFRIFSDFF